jgi:hypothetical protein
MARPEVTGRGFGAGRRKRPSPPVRRAGKSVAEFCEGLGISRSTYESWRRLGVGPAEIQPVANGRIIISEQAEQEWLAKRAALAAVADPAE